MSNLDELNIPPTHSINAYPNPAHEFATIELRNNTTGIRRIAEVNIYNIRGQRVISLESDNTFESPIKIVWDRRDSNGKTCPAGVYLVRDSLKPGMTIKLVLMK